MFRIEEPFDIDDIIRQVFLGDSNLLSKYHYESPTDYKEACQYTSLYSIRDVPKETVFYAIYCDNILFGYVMIENNNIWDLAFCIKSRKDDVLILFYKYLFSMLGTGGTIRLYERNHRDINLLIRNGLARAVAFDKYIKKAGYDEQVQDGVMRSIGKQIIFVPLSQIILQF